MDDGDRQFDYVAVDAGGRRVKGSLAAADDGGAFERLKRGGLSPLRIPAGKGRPRRAVGDRAGASRARQLTDRETAEFLSDLSVLLQAGANVRAALGVL